MAEHDDHQARMARLDAMIARAERLPSLPEMAAQLARLAQEMQSRLWLDVPYIPLGSWVRATAHRRNIVDLPWGHAAFYGVRRI